MRSSDYDGRGYDPPYEQAPDLSRELAKAESERDAYREAGARLLQAFQKRFCFIEDTMEDCLKTVDMEAELILSKEKELRDMSYCRFGGESDVYVYPTDDGRECCACLLEEGDTSFYETAAGMLGHLVDHIAAGHKVPAEALVRLAEEMKEEGWT